MTKKPLRLWPTSLYAINYLSGAAAEFTASAFFFPPVTMDLSNLNLINENFLADKVTPFQMDFLLAEGWRHFGQHFFRYNVGIYKQELRLVHPLRIRLDEFVLTKSKRRIRRKNADLEVVVRPASIDTQKQQLFHRHAARFEHSIPQSIFTFLDENPSEIPCKTLELCVFDKEQLAAVSFFDVGETSVSSIYAMFEPEFAKRSLGILTILLEIEYAIEKGKSHYYLGYAYEGESFYDYKKEFNATETFDWQGRWRRGDAGKG